MAGLSRDACCPLTRSASILGLTFALLITAGPVFAGGPRCECKPTVNVGLTTRAGATERAIQRVERFLLDIQEGRLERGLDHLVEHNAEKFTIKRLLTALFRAHRRHHGPYTGFDRIGMQEVGPYVVRANYVLHTETTGVPTTFVLSRVCDDWALEYFDLAESGQHERQRPSG